MEYYAVAIGRQTGIYNTWSDTQKHVANYEGARYKKFGTLEEAEKFIRNHKKPGSVLQQLGMEIEIKSDNNEMPTDGIVAFTDGAAKGNGTKNARCGSAVVFPLAEHEHLNKSYTFPPGATNNRAEYTAVQIAIEQADLYDPTKMKTLYIYTDSKLIIDSMTKWIKGWKKSGWIKSDGNAVLNMDILQRIDELSRFRTIIYRHVRSHTGLKDWASIWNDKVDKAATSACAATAGTFFR